MLALTAETHEDRRDLRVWNTMMRDFRDVELHDSLVDLSEPQPWDLGVGHRRSLSEVLAILSRTQYMDVINQ